MPEKLIALTDDEIDALSTEELRKTARKYDLGDYSTHKSIMTIVLTPTMVASGGAMTAYGQLIDRIKNVYDQAGEKVVVTVNGDTVEVKTWQDDYYIRSSLRWARQYRQDAADKAAATNTDE